MFDEPNDISPLYAQTLKQWTRAWFDEAVEAEFIRPPYHPDTAAISRLRDYFHAGLSPAEAAQAYFGYKH
jgi:hypothetical protein